jgi:toxin HigB-1
MRRAQGGEKGPLAGSNAARYHCRMIQSFTDADTAKVWRRTHVPKFSRELQRSAHRKLLMLDAAESINDLRSPPGNRLEKLSGSRAGQCSIRINDQWRVCFIWTNAGPTDVEITDYH